MSTALSPTASLNTAYEINGPCDAPVILTLGGISAGKHVVRNHHDSTPGWWECVAGPGNPIDTETYRVLSVEFLDGGCREDGRPAEIVTTYDQAVYIIGLLDELNIERLHALIGASYGGMVALVLAQHFPERVGRLIVISAAHDSHPMATGLRAVQRRVVELGLETGRANEGMALGRAIAMTTYRTAHEFAERFDAVAVHAAGAVEFDVERYLMTSGSRFAERMAPARFLALSLSADLHRAVPEHIHVPTTVIAAQGDTLVPPSLLRALSRRLPQLKGFYVIRTRFGHDAFLTEPERLGDLLTSALSD
ncbi:MAG: homoserine O-succinyltransferase [bacterium]